MKFKYLKRCEIIGPVKVKMQDFVCTSPILNAANMIRANRHGKYKPVYLPFVFCEHT